MIVGLGAKSDHIATVPNADPVRLNLSPDETQVFACVGRVARIGEVLERSGLPEARVIAVLLALRAKGAIAPARVQKNEARKSDVDAAQLEDVDLDEERKREILEFEKGLETLDYFALLKVPPGSSPAEVKKAYYEASRRFHPDRFYGKNLGSYRGRVERIFRKVSEAQEVLTSPDKRREYLAKNPHLAVAAPPPGSTSRSMAPGGARPLFDDEPTPSSPEALARLEERRARFSRHPYLARAQKVNELVARARTLSKEGDFEKALMDLTQASQLDPKNREAPQLMVEIRRKYDSARAQRELDAAKEAEVNLDSAEALRRYRVAASLDDRNADLAFRTARLLHQSGGDPKEARALAQRAVELDPISADHHYLLGVLILQTGLKKAAKRHFEDALNASPEHADAKAQLKKLRWTF